MTDLVEFLKARLDEEVQRAVSSRDPWFGYEPDEHVERVKWADALFIAHHSPTRVLAEVDAKRRIVELHTPVILRSGGGGAYFDTTRVCRSCEPPRQFPEQAWPCATLRLLALPYADHADYDEAWHLGDASQPKE
ncbi:DUF6221 family protein [Streptomyces showdoensis]|nr:DUF6221 family protein [Streptomyces showdoensis]